MPGGTGGPYAGQGAKTPTLDRGRRPLRWGSIFLYFVLFVRFSHKIFENIGKIRNARTYQKILKITREYCDTQSPALARDDLSPMTWSKGNLLR